ncbi:hemagglutinin repeat-containing protein, partial [Oligella urethralis]|uniref:hemagglutinin repeat-containing protein n=1 Tax=Oligella urethralis TaxID=90245 RepID=UPI000AFF0D0A
MGNVGTHLAAENQLLITSAEAMDQSRSKNSSSGWNAGLAIEFGQGGTSMGVTAGANLGKGHANADSLSHRHSHIGSLGSLTSLSAGGSTTLAGAQVFGEEVHVKTPNLIIQSVQDTATYEGKQQEMGGQITVGYGVSGSANFSRSSINADYASVTEQSGIYAGDGGYQIEVA